VYGRVVIREAIQLVEHRKNPAQRGRDPNRPPPREHPLDSQPSKMRKQHSQPKITARSVMIRDIALVWFALLIRAAHLVVHLLRRPRLQRGLQRLIGCVLITLGISVARTAVSP